MPELVGKGHDITHFPLIIQEDVRMGAGHGRVREGAGGLAISHRGVDPAIGEKAAGDGRHLGREEGIGAEHGGPRLVEFDEALRHLGQGGIPIPEGESFAVQPLRLQPVISVREAGIGLADRRGEGLGDPWLDAVAQVARRRDVIEFAPAVGDLLVLGERVGDEREQPQVVLEGRGKRLGRLVPLRPVGILERLRVGSIASSSSPTLKRRLVMVSLKSRFQPPRPVTISRGRAARPGPRAGAVSPSGCPRATAGNSRASDPPSPRREWRRRSGSVRA